MLQARGLSKSFRGPSGPVPVLDGVDLRVEAGQLVAITGSSGSGKSTLLNLLGLLEDAEAGEVWFGADRVSAWSRAAKSATRGRRVGFVFQSFLLLPSLTALDNVLLAARYVGGVDGGRRRRALDLLETFGLTARAAHYPRSSPAASSSGWRSAAPCSTSRRSCSPTSPRAISTT